MKKRFLLAGITAFAVLLIALGPQTKGVSAASSSSAQTTLHETAISSNCNEAHTGADRGFVDWVRVGSISANVHLRHALKNQFYHINWLCKKDDIGGIFTDKNGNGDGTVQFDPGKATHFTLQLIAAAGGAVIDEIRDNGTDLK